jgi:hypothetical protein
VNEEVEALAREYFAALNIPEKAKIDAFHLAWRLPLGTKWITCSHGTASILRADACRRCYKIPTLASAFTRQLSVRRKS